MSNNTWMRTGNGENIMWTTGQVVVGIKIVCYVSTTRATADSPARGSTGFEITIDEFDRDTLCKKNKLEWWIFTISTINREPSEDL